MKKKIENPIVASFVLPDFTPLSAHDNQPPLSLLPNGRFVIRKPTLAATTMNDRVGLRPQPIDATHWLNRSACVSKLNVFLGRSFSCRATASLGVMRRSGPTRACR
jgi:hypothetical protein